MTRLDSISGVTCAGGCSAPLLAVHSMNLLEAPREGEPFDLKSHPGRRTKIAIPGSGIAGLAIGRPDLARIHP